MIKIEQLLPLLKKGWVAMDENGRWYWYSEKPVRISSDKWAVARIVCTVCLFRVFDIISVEDWTKSLMRCGDE